MNHEQRLYNYIAVLKEELSTHLFQNLLPSAPRRTPQVGDIWMLKKKEKQTLALITFHDEDVTRGVLLGNEITVASQDDVLIPPQDNTLNRQLFASLWWDEPFTREHCTHFLGRVERPSLDVVLYLLQNQLTGGYRVRAKERAIRENTPVIVWTISSIGNPQKVLEYTTGRMLLSPQDLRYEARSILRSAHEWVEQPLVQSVFERILASLSDFVDHVNSELSPTLIAQLDPTRGGPTREAQESDTTEPLMVLDIPVGGNRVIFDITLLNAQLLIRAQALSKDEAPVEGAIITLKWDSMENQKQTDEDGVVRFAPVSEHTALLSIEIQIGDEQWSQAIPQ